MSRAEKIEAAARALSRVLGEVATTDPTVRWNMSSAVALSDAQRDLTAALAASPEVKPTGPCDPECSYCREWRAEAKPTGEKGALIEWKPMPSRVDYQGKCRACGASWSYVGSSQSLIEREHRGVCKPAPAPASEARCEECGGTGRCTCDGCKTDGKERACRTCGGTGGAREGTDG